MKHVRKYWVVATVLVGFAPYAYAKSVKTGENPFEFARELVESTGVQSLNSVAMKTPDLAKPQLQYRGKSGQNQAQTDRLLKDLTQKFGPPKSVRGADHVWEVENPNAGLSQSKLITIILSVDGNGGSELIMDRNRGEDGRATWALPRRKLSQETLLHKQQQHVKRAPLVNPD